MTLWSCGNSTLWDPSMPHNAPDACIEGYLERLLYPPDYIDDGEQPSLHDLPETIELHRWERWTNTVESVIETHSPLAHLVSALEASGSLEATKPADEPSAVALEAEKRLVGVVLDELCGHQLSDTTAINVLDWITTHRPEWLPWEKLL